MFHIRSERGMKHMAPYESRLAGPALPKHRSVVKVGKGFMDITALKISVFLSEDSMNISLCYRK